MKSIATIKQDVRIPKKFNALLEDINSSVLLTTQDLGKKEIVNIRHGFNIGSVSLLVPKKVPSEIIIAPLIYPIPNTPQWFSGFINHRGETLPVFYLEALFHPKTKQEVQQQWVLILRQQQQSCGLLLNSYPYKLDNLKEIVPEQVCNIPEVIRPYLEKAFYDGRHEWLDFRHHDFLLSLHDAFRRQSVS